MGAKNDFSKKISNTVLGFVGEGNGMTVGQIWRNIKEQFPEEFSTYMLTLADIGGPKIVADILKSSGGETQSGIYQYRIAGTETPKAFCYIDDDKQKVWILTDIATQKMMLSHNRLLKKNIKGVTKKQQEWQEKLDYLEPAFIERPGCTVGDAVSFLDKKAA